LATLRFHIRDLQDLILRELAAGVVVLERISRWPPSTRASTASKVKAQSPLIAQKSSEGAVRSPVISVRRLSSDRQKADGFKIHGEIYITPDRIKRWVPTHPERAASGHTAGTGVVK